MISDDAIWQQKILDINDDAAFNEVAIALFKVQAKHCKPYGDFIKLLNIDCIKIKYYDQIPFLPITFFKSHQVITKQFNPQAIFTSSGTTGDKTSQHHIKNLNWYETVSANFFSQHYEKPNLKILGLLPSYLERSGSSLIYMVRKLMRLYNGDELDFYLYDTEALYLKLKNLAALGQPTVLFGVTFALTDFSKRYEIDFPQLTVIETGGMKGRGYEPIRATIHDELKKCFFNAQIHSEYGMTELLSQAYALDGHHFITPQWMKLLLRDTNDPLTLHPIQGGINVIDLANFATCAFIATQDLGRKHPNGIEVLGRFDHADVRGCSMLIQ